MLNTLAKYLLLPLIPWIFPIALYAQSFYNTSPQQNASPPPAQSLSDEEYKNMINNQSKQNQQNLSQSAKQQLESQAPALPVLPPPVTVTPTPSAAPAETMTTPTVAAPPVTPPTTITTPPVIQSGNRPAPSMMHAPSQTGLAPVDTPVPSAPLPAPPLTGPSGTSAGSQSQQQVYTGFGNSDQRGAKSSSEKSSGWNIQY